MNSSIGTSSENSTSISPSYGFSSPVERHKQLMQQSKKSSKRPKTKYGGGGSISGKIKIWGKRGSLHKKFKHSMSASLHGLTVSQKNKKMGKSSSASCGEIGRQMSFCSNHSAGSRGAFSVMTSQTYHGQPRGFLLSDGVRTEAQGFVATSSPVHEIDALKKQIKSVQETIRSTRKENHQLLEDAQELLEENDNVQKQLKEALTMQQTVEQELDSVTLKLHKTEAEREHLQSELGEIKNLLLKQVKSELAENKSDDNGDPKCCPKERQAQRRASLLSEVCDDEAVVETSASHLSVGFSAPELIQLLSNVQKRPPPYSVLKTEAAQTQNTTLHQINRQALDNVIVESNCTSKTTSEQPKICVDDKTVESQGVHSPWLYLVLVIGGAMLAIFVQKIFSLS